jgi:hypothetical protein
MNESSTEITATSADPDKYPYLENIRLIGKQSKSTKPIYQQIGMAVHHHTGKGFLGFATKTSRMASSIVLSTMRQDGEYRCIATQLHCCTSFDENERQAFYKELNERSKNWQNT